MLVFIQTCDKRMTNRIPQIVFEDTTLYCTNKEEERRTDRSAGPWERNFPVE